MLSSTSSSSASGRTTTPAAEVWTRFGGGDALHAVDAAFVFEEAVDFLAGDVEGDVFVAAGGAFVEVDDFDFPVLLFAVAGVHAEEVACEDAGFVAAGAAADFDYGVFAVGGVGGDEEDADFFLHFVAPLGAFGQFGLGHFAQFFVFLCAEEFFALGYGVEEGFVVVVGFDYGLEVFVVFAEFDVAFHVGCDLRVVHLLLNFLVAGVNGFEFVYHGVGGWVYLFFVILFGFPDFWGASFSDSGVWG